MAAKEFPLSVVIRAIDRVTAPMKAIQASVGRFGSSIAGKFKGLSERVGLPVLTAAAGRAAGAVGELGRRMAIMGAGVAALAATVAVAAYRIVQSFADVAGGINDASTAIGVSAEALQEWRYAAKQNGVEAELLDNSLMILGKNLGKAFKGKGPAELLQAMHIRLRNANGTFKTTDQLLPEIADGLARIQNPALRANAAAELFGKGGVKLLPMLKDGSNGLAEYARRARELGIVLDNETVKAADDFGDKLDDMKGALSGVRNVIGTALLPVLSKLTDRFTNWLISIRPRMQAWFEGFAAELPARIESLIQLFDDLRAKLQPVINAFAWLVEKFGGANVIIGAVASAIAIFLVPALYSAATAFYALGVAILTTPVGWIALAIAALVAAFVLLYNKSETVRKITAYVGASMLVSAEATMKLVEALFKLAAAFIDWYGAAYKAVSGWYEAFVGKIRTGVEEAIQWIQGFASRIAGLVPDWLKNLLGGGASIAVNAMAAGPAGAALGVASAAASAVGAQNGNVRVQVDLNNLPPGSRVQTDQRGQPQFELNQGYAFGGT